MPTDTQGHRPTQTTRIHINRMDAYVYVYMCVCMYARMYVPNKKNYTLTNLNPPS